MALALMDPGDDGEVDLASMTLEQLAERINAEYQQVEAAAERAASQLSEGLEHAIVCGRYLAAVKAKLRSADGRLTTHTAAKYLSGLRLRRRSTPQISDEVQTGIKRLVGAGMTQVKVAEMLNVSRRTIWFYSDPDAAARMKARDRETNRRRREARSALCREEERKERDRLAAERGGNLGKVSDIVRLKLMPAIDAAVSEGTLPIEARAVALRLEDEIFKALKR